MIAAGGIAAAVMAWGDGRRQRRVVTGGPGPSGIELPAGCWRMKLRWSGRQDSLDLRYVQ